MQKINKFTGIGEIDYLCLKDVPLKGVSFLTCLVTACNWKFTKVDPIAKRNNPVQLSVYTPITPLLTYYRLQTAKSGGK